MPLIAYPCRGFEVTSGLGSADILKIYRWSSHCFAGHTQIPAVMQRVSVIYWKKEGTRSVLSILAWSGWCTPTERPSLGPSHPSEEQIRSRVDGPARHENRERDGNREEQAFSFFSALWQSWWSTRADNGSVWGWYAPDTLVYCLILTLNCISYMPAYSGFFWTAKGKECSWAFCCFECNLEVRWSGTEQGWLLDSLSAW